jgi:hypothetical protein
MTCAIDDLRSTILCPDDIVEQAVSDGQRVCDVAVYIPQEEQNGQELNGAASEYEFAVPLMRSLHVLGTWGVTVRHCIGCRTTMSPSLAQTLLNLSVYSHSLGPNLCYNSLLRKFSIQAGLAHLCDLHKV